MCTAFTDEWLDHGYHVQTTVVKNCKELQLESPMFVRRLLVGSKLPAIFSSEGYGSTEPVPC